MTFQSESPGRDSVVTFGEVSSDIRCILILGFQWEIYWNEFAKLKLSLVFILRPWKWVIFAF